MTCPTVEEVARAIVAACRETGEDPIACASGERGAPGKQGCRARHYAMHALAELYPPRLGCPEDRALLARLCGVRWGHKNIAYTYFSTSLNQVFKPFVSELHPEMSAPHWARWFDDEAFARVKMAIRPSGKALLPIPAKTKPGMVKGEFDGPLTMRRKPAVDFENVTAYFMGDPSPERSALARCKGKLGGDQCGADRDGID